MVSVLWGDERRSIKVNFITFDFFFFIKNDQAREDFSCDSMTSTTQGQWEKVLWREQPYPDNHVDSKFLESLVVNASVAKRSYWKVVEGALLVAEQLCLVSLLSGVAFSLHEVRLRM